MASNAPEEPEIAALKIRNGISYNGKQKFRKRKLCKTCQEIGRKEEEAAKRGKDVIRTKLKAPYKAPAWQGTMCKPHAKLAGRSKDKLFDNAGKMKNQHQQKKLPFMVLNNSQFQMAEVSHGSEENPLRNPMEE